MEMSINFVKAIVSIVLIVGALIILKSNDHINSRIGLDQGIYATINYQDLINQFGMENYKHSIDEDERKEINTKYLAIFYSDDILCNHYVNNVIDFINIFDTSYTDEVKYVHLYNIEEDKKESTTVFDAHIMANIKGDNFLFNAEDYFGEFKITISKNNLILIDIDKNELIARLIIPGNFILSNDWKKEILRKYIDLSDHIK